VIAVGHRRHEPLVLADDELLILILGEGREDPGLSEPGFVKRYSTPASFRV